MHIPGGTAQLTRAKGQSLQFQTEGDGELNILPIAFLRHTRCNKDQLYLFEIANSHGCIGEQVRGDMGHFHKNVPVTVKTI